MANTKTIVTRIKNKVDTLANWNSYNGVLLDGEIAVVRVPTGTSYTNPVTGKSEPVVELLMKVGDGVHKFNETDTNGNLYLPWMSAKASDVYDWAKAATVEFDTTDYKVKFKDASGAVITKATIDMSDIDSRLTALESKDITVTPSDTAKPGVVQSVTKGDDHEIYVTYGLVQTGDVADAAVTTAKIADSTVTTTKIADKNVTAAKLATDAVETEKIKNGAVTNDKLATGLSTDKFTIDSKTLTAKIGEMDAAIAGKEGTHDHPYLPDTTTYALSDTVGGDALVAKVAKKVENKLSITLNGGTATEFDGSAVKSIDVTPAAIGAATQAAVFGTGGLSETVAKNTAAIEDLKEEVTGGVHFIGTVTAKPTTASITVNGSTSHTAEAGDIVVWSAKHLEYIYTGAAWEELGDPSGLGAMIEALDYNGGAFGASKFVTKVTQENGQIAAEYAQPTSADITHNSTTVKAALETLDANKSDNTHGHGNIDKDGKLNTASRVVITGTDNKVTVSDITTTELSYLDDVTSNIQTQLNGKSDNGHNHDERYVRYDVSTQDLNDSQKTNARTNINAAAADHSHDDTYGQAIANIQAHYVRCTTTDKTDAYGNATYQMHLGTEDDVIIFDCGGAND